MIRKLFRSRFVKDSAILQASGLIVALSGAASTLVLAHVLGDELQGRYILATSVYALVFMLFNTGVTQATVSQLGIAIGENRLDRVTDWLAFLVKVNALAGAFLVILVGPFLPWICEQVLDSRRVGELGWMLSVVPLLDIPRVVAVAVLQAGRRMAEVARIEVAAELARLVLVVCGALLTHDPVGPVLGMVAATAFGSLVATLRYRSLSLGQGVKLPSARRVLGSVRAVPMAQGLRLGVRLGVLRSLDALAYEILPPLFIKSAGHAAGFANAEAWVAHFRIAQRLMKLPVVFMQGVSRTALPALAQYVGAGDGEGFRRGFVRVTLFSTVLVAAAVGVTTLAVPLLVEVAPEKYEANVIALCRVMALGYCLMGTMVAFDTFYILTNRLRVVITVCIVQAVVTFPALWLLCYEVPRTGAGWGMVMMLSWSLFHVGYIALYFRSGKHLVDFAGRKRVGGAPPPEQLPLPFARLVQRVRSSRFARDAGLLQVSGMGVAAGALLSSVAVSRLVGDQEQGRYFLALAGYGLCYMLLAMGVVQATVGQVAAARAREQWDKVAAWLAFAFKTQALIGSLLLAVGYFTVRPLVALVTHDEAIGLWAWWLCAIPLLEAPKTMVTCALQGGRRMRALATMELGLEAARVLLVIGAVSFVPTAEAAVLGSIAASGVGVGVALLVLRAEARRPDSFIPSVRGVFSRVGDVPVSYGLPLSFRMGVMRGIDALGVNVLPPLILKAVAQANGFGQADAWVAYFRVAQRIMQIPVILLQGLSRTMLPSLSQVASSRDPVRFRSLFLRVSGLGGLLVAVGLAVSYPIMLLVVRIYEPSYHEPVAKLAGILALGLALQGFAGSLDAFYLAANRLRVAIALSAVGLVVTIPAMGALVAYSPTTGVAWGMVVVLGWTLVHYAYVAYYFRRGTHLRELGAPGSESA